MTASTDRFVADHVKSIPRSGIRDFFAIVANMPEAISLGIGEPDFVTPWHIREASIFALERGRTSYTDNLGLLSLRREITRYVESDFGISYHPENETLVTVGVSEALDLALRALLNPGEAVLFHEPCYVSYHPGIRLAHGIGIPVATHPEDDFSLSVEALREAWTPKCKILLLSFPSNPTGATLSRSQQKAIAAFADEKDLLVITDEIYSELTYGGDHQSIASLPGMKDRTLFLHGFSKAFAMTGFRIGFACAPQPIIEAMMRVHQYSMLCAPILSQEAALEALRNGRDSMLKMKAKYHERRDFVVRRLRESGLSCHNPGGAFYVFPGIQNLGLNSMEFAHQLLEKKKVAVVPGAAFGASGEGFFRASYSTSMEKLIEAYDRIEAFVQGLSGNPTQKD